MDCRRYEVYTKDGLLQWVAIPMKIFLWLQRQTILVIGPILLVSLVWLGVVNVVEDIMMMFHYPLWFSIVIVVVVTSLCMTSRGKQKKKKLRVLSVLFSFGMKQKKVESSCSPR